MKSLLSCTLLAIALHPLYAADAAPGAPVTPSPWSHQLKIGFYLNSISTANAEASNDATIGGASNNSSYTLDLDGRLKWEQGKDSFQQDLILKYGRKYDETSKWQENTDIIDYDGVYTRNISTVHNYYASIGVDTVFTGPDEDESPFDPLTGKISTGYKYSRENIFPIKDVFSSRVGVRAQRTWGDNASAEQKDTQTGLEWVTRYERQQTEQLSYFAQYDFFSEFKDLNHMIHIIQAGLDYRITPLLSIKLDLRGYYETKPEDLGSGANDETYDTFSMRQETMIGITYAF